jgi:5'(3')-deoxyribonucleotidase
MRKLQIILDSDEVIARNIDLLLNMYNAEYKTSVTRNELLEWDLTKVQKEGTDILKYFNQPGFFRHLPLIEESQIYIKQLIEDGHDVVVATSSPKNGILDKIEFFEEYFPFIPFSNIIPITRKDLLKGDIMLDDAPHNLEFSGCRYPVVFDNLWNQNTEKYPFLKDLKRVSTWKEFYEFVCEIATEDTEERAS